MNGSSVARLAAVALLALPLPARAQTDRAQTDAPAAATEAAKPADAAEPAPEALAQAWFDQLYGADSIAIWRSEWAGGELVYGVARRWHLGQPEIFVHIFAPRAYDELNFLLREREDARSELLYYRTPKLFPGGAKAARVMPTSVPAPLERMPFAQGLPALVDVKPPVASDFAFTRLPDASVAKRPCRVLEGRPRSAELGFDRVRLSLARETGVALETAWYSADTLLRRVLVDPADVRDYDGRMLPARISVEQPGNETQVYALSSLRIDPVFPDVLFTTQNLKLGRFPSY
jgi:hypothetical protein